MKSSQIASLVQQLRDASSAYYNGGVLLMDDETFDAAVDRLRELDPAHPFLSEIGSTPTDGTAVPLPVPMPSLDKIKPGEDRLTRFLAASGPFVVSEKLDGLSALWIPAKKKLYLRGDGLKGQDVSHLVALGIQGLRPPAADEGGEVVRGELILPRAAGEALARSWVNGVVHRSNPASTDVSRIRFVAYELVKPSGISRSQQFVWLTSDGYEVPWHTTVAHLDETTLAKWLQDRRATSLYDTDGLVVGLDATAPKSESTATKVRNPKDCVAFKMPLADQSAETTVQAVEWGISAQGYMIPTLRFEPVVIGSATIQCCTGHNAKTVLEGRIGPGARVVIRRSGDVIPKLDRVVTGAPEVPFPAEGTYEWDATHTHIRIKTGSESGCNKELRVARLGHFLKTLDIPGSGPATAAALVEAGYDGPAKLWGASPEQLSACLGPKTGASLSTNLREALGRTDEKTLMLASSQMPRGVGETKLSTLYAISANPSEWSSAVEREGAPTGWTPVSLETFWPALATYEAWRKRELSWIPYPLKAAAGPLSQPVKGGGSGVVCFSGFRDKELEAAALGASWMIAPTFTGKVTHLVVPDGPLKESEKTKSAKAKGIPILSCQSFRAQYLTKTG